MEQESLATELMHEIKASAKRWFIAFCIMVILELFTIVGFIWYISLPLEETSTTITQDADGVNGNRIQQIVGGEEEWQE